MDISVIITVYNKSNFVSRCVNSVINQTYDNFEAVIIDDCSTDNSLSICQELIKQYDGNIQWRVIPQEKNIGVSAIRNIGIEEAKGEYIFYLDGDDELAPTCLESFVDKMIRYPNGEIIVGKIVSIPQNDYYNTDFFDDVDYIDNNLWIREHFYGQGCRIPVNPVNKLINRNFLIKNQLYYKPNIYHEDELWMFFVVKKLTKIAFVHDITYIRYYVENSIMTSNGGKGHTNSWNTVLNTVCQNFDSPFKLHQINRYFIEYLVRFKELNQIEATNLLNKKFSNCYLMCGKIKFVFALFRMNSSNKQVILYYTNYLLEIFRENKKLSFVNMIGHEIDFLRVKLALGKFFYK